MAEQPHSLSVADLGGVALPFGQIGHAAEADGPGVVGRGVFICFCPTEVKKCVCGTYRGATGERNANTSMLTCSQRHRGYDP